MPTSDVSSWQAAAVALAIGLLIGSERERSGHGEHPAGVRTFGLAGLAGCVAALIGLVALAATIAGIAALAAVGFLRSAEPERGATTEVALILTAGLGGLATSAPALAAAAGVAAAVVLVSKQRLHTFVRQTVSDLEVTDALKFFVVAFIVLPLVPHAELGPYGAIDPRRIWTLVVAVTALGWLGYLAVRILGPSRGLPIAGLAGGFVSGAATTAAMARQARSAQLRPAALAGALLASVATLVQLVAVTAIADRRVALLLVPAAAAGSLVLAVLAARLARSTPSEGDPMPGSATPAEASAGPADEHGLAPAGRALPRPFALTPALLLAGALAVLLVVAEAARDAFGAGGAVVAIAAAGLADAHAGALTAASLAATGALPPGTAAAAALAAVGVNTVVKVGLAIATGGSRVARILALLLAVPIAVVTATAVVTLSLTA